MYSSNTGGTRGGRDQFSWENVKDDKDRECYLGHSLMAPIGRWQKGRDLLWYTKNKQEDGDEAIRRQRQLEIQAIKEAEADALSEALGFAPQKRHKTSITEDELKAVLKKEKTIEEGDETEHDVKIREADRLQGLGYQESRRFGPTSHTNASTASDQGGLMRLEKGDVLPGRTSSTVATVTTTTSTTSLTSTTSMHTTMNDLHEAKLSSKKDKKKKKKEKREKDRKSHSSRKYHSDSDDNHNGGSGNGSRHRTRDHRRSRRESPYRRHERHSNRDNRRDRSRERHHRHE